jgi:hypothetical protein
MQESIALQRSSQRARPFHTYAHETYLGSRGRTRYRQPPGALLGVFKLLAGVVKAVNDPAGLSSDDMQLISMSHGHRYPVTFPPSRSGF